MIGDLTQSEEENMPKVSIIMPFKDEELYLKACLDSIIGQEYTFWELIAVDDHSSDRSFQILKQYQESDPRIKLFQNSDSGLISALNTGYAHAEGAYVTRMDADDIMTTARVSSMVHQLQEHGIGHIAVGLVNYFSDTQLMDGYKNYEKWLNGLTLLGENFKEIYKECVVPSPCWMVHREDFDIVGGFDSEIYPEDYDLCFRFYAQKLKIIPCDQIFLLWRDYPTRSSRTSKLYEDNQFINLKVHYFVAIDYDPNRILYVWGAGTRGKKIAKEFKNKGLDIKWVCNNEKKIGKNIYGFTIQSDESISYNVNPQLIIAVANIDEQSEIKSTLNSKGLESGEDYFFFC